MVELVFSLRFQSQLRRTRPKLLSGLEKTLIEAIEKYGGKVKVEHKTISAVFNRETIGFWLDILCLLETIKKILEKASSELYGHVCIIGEDIDDSDASLLVKALPSGLRETGIWCAPDIAESLGAFIDFDKALPGDDPGAGYSQVRSIRELGDASEIQTREKNNSEKIRAYLKQGTSRNSIIVGDERIGKLEGLYRYCEEQMKGFPPLLVRFKEGVHTVICFADAFSPEIRKHLDSNEDQNLDQLYKTMFQERLRGELSSFTIKRGRQFFEKLLEAYKNAAEKRSVKSMMILENIQDAEASARLFITDINNAYPARERIKIYGTATKLKALESWEELFPRIIKFTPEKPKSREKQILPRDLWEMGYCCDLIKRYFPSFLIPQLLQEEGKNPVMIEKTLSLLSRVQAIDQINFSGKADEILGKDAEAVRDVVRRRLLAWVKDFRLQPCFALISALANLGAKGEDNLVLDSICADLINGTYKSIEKSIEDETFSSIAGNDKALLAIVKTQKALSCQSREEIISAFKDMPAGAELWPSRGSGLSASPGIQSRLFANASSYYLGICDTRAAADSIKEGMLLAQKENKGRGLARIYRIFSLVEFSSQRLSDAIDYFSFAIEHAEKAGDQTELGLSYYYSAVVHFIFGNISRAKQLAVNAQKAALKALLPGWAERSRFFEGRLCFETGQYQEALDIFQELRADCAKSASESNTRDFLQTIDAWIFRAGVYLNKTAKPPKELKGRDALLFKTEAAFICGDCQKTLELIAEMEQAEHDDRFNYIEQPDWRSGFHQCELLLFPEQTLWSRMTCTFKALALCYMANEEKNSENSPGKNEAIREMQQMIRNNLPETDPNDAFYLHSYYRILKLTEAPDVDLNTAVSLAFKRLQKRASRIEDNETKRAFLFTHYWNSALTAAAKEHKLI